MTRHRFGAPLLALLMAATLAGCSGGSAGAAVEMNSGFQGHCFGGGESAKAWTDQTTSVTEFGIDYFFVKGSSTVHVTRVYLSGGNGLLRLEDVAFVPGGAVGNGFTFGSPRANAIPANWQHRIEMTSPTSQGSASLSPLHPTAADLASDPEAGQYQLVIGVTPTTDPSSADHAVIDYTVKGHHHQALGKAFLRMSTSSAGSCAGPAG